PDGRAMLLDAGSASLTDLTRKCLGPFLRHEGVNRIDDLWLSHGDYDHISAAAEVLGVYDVRRIALSPHFKRHAIESAATENVLETIDRLKVPLEQLVAGDQSALSSDAWIDVLWPPENCSFNSNNTGLVLRLCYAG